MMSVKYTPCPGKRRKLSSPPGVVRCRICMRAVTTLILSAVVASSFEFVALSCNAGPHRAKARSAVTAFASTESGSKTSSIPSEGTVRVVVKRSMRNPVDTSQLAAHGSVFYATGYDDGWVLMQTISGVADGKDVIAVVSPGKYSPGSSVDVEYRHLLEKPGHLDWDRAAMLPFLAINCLCPLRDVGYDQSNARGQNFVVTGGHGSLAPFMVQVLKAWGANVHCVTTRSQADGRELGAESVVDFREKSYSEEIDTVSVVIDTLGREKEGSARILKKTKGAAYLSLQPKILEVAIEEGVIFGAGKILQYQQVLARADARVYFLPNAEAMGLVSHVASMVSSRDVKCGEIGTEYVGMQEYLEALAWPKDTDTGLRYGFPGKTGRSWGWLEGGFEEMEDDGYYDEDEDGDGYVEVDGEREPDYRRSSAGSIAATQGPPSIPAGEVVPLNSREELMALARERGSIVFISSRSCRVCKFLSPFYRKLARRQQLVWFGYVDASSNPEIARELGLKAVPSFVTFKEGELVSSTNTNNREKIEKLVEELLPS